MLETDAADAGSGCFDEAIAAAYVAGDLAPEEIGRVDAHIDSCVACRRHVSELARLRTDAARSTGSGSAGYAAPKAHLPAGTHVGRYVIDEPIGAGGMGVVYAAHDPQLHRKVALKRVLGDVTPASQKRLLREAQAMARLSHTNVVTVHDIVLVGPEMFIAMEYVDGVTLKEWLREESRPYARVLGAFCEAGRGLAAAHAVGLVHGDFKPSNVMVDRAGRVRVTDFGLAREPTAEVFGSFPVDSGHGPHGDDPSLAFRTMAGTPAYMAPEGRSGGAVDARSDQFSFAIALYEGLYQQHPFGGETGAEMMERAARGIVREVPPDGKVPARIHRGLLRALRVPPAERFPGMDDLLRELSLETTPVPRAAASLASKAGIAFSLGLAGIAAAWALAVHRAPAPDASPGPPRADTPPATTTELVAPTAIGAASTTTRASREAAPGSDSGARAAAAASESPSPGGPARRQPLPSPPRATSSRDVAPPSPAPSVAAPSPRDPGSYL
jgi:serine/threonine protein kinase